MTERNRFMARQVFERAAFVYGQAVALRKHTAEGTKERRDAVSAEDVAESRMAAAAAKMFQQA